MYLREKGSVVEKGLVHLFIPSSSFHFFNKTDFNQYRYLFKSKLTLYFCLHNLNSKHFISVFLPNLNSKKLTQVESRTQGSRPRTQKNPRPRTDFLRTDTLKAKDRNAQDQGPRTQAFSKRKKKSAKIYLDDLHKKGLQKSFFQAISKKKKKELEALNPRPRT